MTCTLVGPDLASYQAGLDLSRLSSAPFVIAKATQGISYVDPSYDGWRRQAAQLGKLFVWYHFLSADPAAQQVSNTLAHVGDATLPGMVDIEPSGDYSPTLAEAFGYIDAARAAGLRVRLAYLPQWYWQSLGSPDLSGFTQRGVHLVSSDYKGVSGTPGQVYAASGGDAGSGWAPYGNVVPLLWQFTDQASDGGQTLDENAFRGTVAELAAQLGTTIPAQVTPPAIESTLVRALQQELNAYGHYGLAVDGVKGPQTDAAIRSALGALLGPGSSGGRVRVLQAALAAAGQNVVVDGSFGPLTTSAVEGFQRAHGLTADGEIGPLTVNALAG
jgi:hypothetical protein